MSIPYVLQLNKRDLPNVVPRGGDEARCSRRRTSRSFEAVASKGIGVFETLKGVAKLVLSELTKTSVASL